MNPQAMPSTIALFASSRRHGNTGQLMDRIAKELKIEVIDLARLNISPYDYDHNNRDDDFEPLMQHVLGYEQIILASPVYWYGVSAPMKVFLDRVSDFLDIPELQEQGRRLRGKRGFVVCTSVYDEVAPPFSDALKQTFEYLGMSYGGVVHANCSGGYQAALYEADMASFVALVSNGAGLSKRP
jgi:multimeric flavodoxin WrbA